MMNQKSDDDWMDLFRSGEWIPHEAISENEVLRKRMAEHTAVWSVAKDAYRIKSAFEG
jgi:hypothetical protein